MNSEIKKVLKNAKEYEIIELFKALQIVFGFRDSMLRYGLDEESLVEELKKQEEHVITPEDIKKLLSYQLDIDLEMISKLEAYFAFKEAQLTKERIKRK